MRGTHRHHEDGDAARSCPCERNEAPRNGGRPRRSARALPEGATISAEKDTLEARVPRPGVFTYALDPDEKVVMDDRKRIVGVKSGDHTTRFIAGTATQEGTEVKGELEDHVERLPLLATDRIELRGAFAPGEVVPTGGKIETTRAWSAIGFGTALLAGGWLPIYYCWRDVRRRRESLAVSPDPGAVDCLRDARWMRPRAGSASLFVGRRLAHWFDRGWNPPDDGRSTPPRGPAVERGDPLGAEERDDRPRADRPISADQRGLLAIASAARTSRRVTSAAARSTKSARFGRVDAKDHRRRLARRDGMRVLEGHEHAARRQIDRHRAELHARLTLEEPFDHRMCELEARARRVAVDVDAGHFVFSIRGQDAHVRLVEAQLERRDAHQSRSPNRFRRSRAAWRETSTACPPAHPRDVAAGRLRLELRDVIERDERAAMNAEHVRELLLEHVQRIVGEMALAA